MPAPPEPGPDRAWCARLGGEAGPDRAWCARLGGEAGPDRAWCARLGGEAGQNDTAAGWLNRAALGIKSWKRLSGVSHAQYPDAFATPTTTRKIVTTPAATIAAGTHTEKDGFVVLDRQTLEDMASG
jgi:hypothetical protein